MTIVERTAGDVTILDLNGRLILGEGDVIFKNAVDALVRQGHKKFLLNFADVTFLDSAGVGAVVWKYVTLQKKGGMLKLLNLTTRSHHILLITKLLGVIDTFESEAEALQSFRE